MGQSSFVDALLPPGFGRNEKLERISGLIDWPRLERLVGSARSGETGRPPYAALSMLKALLLQQRDDLSDPALEEALLDRVSFRRFCGFALDAATPDETTLCRFRNALKDAGLGEALFQEVLRQLEAALFVLKTGTLIDATLVRCAVRPPPPGSTPRDQESRSPHDPDANWTREGKARRLFFGYKAHIGIDQGSDLIRSRALTGAKTCESQDLREPRPARAKTCESQDLREPRPARAKTCESEVADALVMGDERAVHADKAYEKHGPGARL
jgi:transposase, IS5 family